MKKHILSLLVSSLLLVGCLQHVSAEEAVPVSNQNFTSENVTSVFTVARRGFTRYKTVFLQNGVVTEVLSDPNWDINKDTHISVKFTESEGPKQCYVMIYYKQDSAANWTMGKAGYLRMQDSALEYDIPEDYSFRITATPSEGNNGNVTFEITLSE